MSVLSWIKASAVAFVFAVIAFFAWQSYDAQNKLAIKTANYDTLATEASTLRGTNAANKATIDRLEATRKLDQAALDRLTAAVGNVAAKAGKTRTIIREIERNDPDAKSVLDLDLPVSVRDALNAAPDH